MVDFLFFVSARFGQQGIDRRETIAVRLLGEFEGSITDGIRCRFVDANGTVFQPTATERLTWQGWRWITMPMDDPNIEHWDGAGDQIDYPIRWDTLLLIDSPGNAHTGTVHFTGVTLIYEG